MKIRKIRIWGLGGLGVMSIVNLKKRLAQKVRRIILLHLGRVTFRIHFGKARKVITFMLFGLGGRVHDSPNQYYLSLEIPGYSK